MRWLGTAADGSPRLAGILRGRSALVELGGDLREVGRLAAPRAPTGLAVSAGGEVFVVGELSEQVARYRRVDDRLIATGSIELPGVRAMRDVATGPEGVIYVVEEHDGRLLTLRPGTAAGAHPPAERVDTALCHGPVQVLRVGPSLLVDCLLDHAVRIRTVDARGFPGADGEARIAHDGPMWGLSAVQDGGGLLVAVGGVEDHPLDRTGGSFGFVDSFVSVYRVAAAGGGVDKLAEVNTSALGLVTPKALRVSRSAAGSLDVEVAGYASSALVRLSWASPGPGEPTVTRRTIPPGTAMMETLPDGSLALANPLLDAWVSVGPAGAAVAHVDDEASAARSADSRLGEALFFTTLMAPWDKSDGPLSRFTCETCHFEGYVDGRTHHTGRGDVHATTKPLLGLFNNRPHFSRALDPDMATMVHNEFRVASANSGHDPWFSIEPKDYPWLADLGLGGETLSPERLRRALMTFLMGFAHRPNPAALDRARFTPLERAGAGVFRARCESCHEARLVADEPSTRVPFERWESLVLSPSGPIVWAHSDYEKTGVVPYVSDKGARVVSLRRLYKKHPYFTNGSAPELGDVLDRVRMPPGGGFEHAGSADAGAGLGPGDKASLAAFLDLL